MSYISKVVACALALMAVSCSSSNDSNAESENQEAKVEIKKNLLYNIDKDKYTIQSDEIQSGETLGKILGRYGVGAAMIDKLDKESDSIFPLRLIRGGNKYTTFTTPDSTAHLDYFVYERNSTDFVTFGFVNDSVSVTTGQKEVKLVRTKHTATIESSLWGAIMEKDMPYAIAAELEDIFQWTVDFFGVKQGDSFTVIYDEKFIDDTVSVGVGQVWGAKFIHADREVDAIPYVQDGKVKWWESNGESLRKQMLKAPLKFTRISSKFTYSRFHPVHKVYRPHTGVDYAAPMGTPVVAVGDGVVTYCQYSGGGGNMIKLKHSGNMQTGYLHLRNFAKGVRVGAHVSQGQVIAYVGSTGTSTGPHLDYRVWRNGKPIDPLKIPHEPAEPISDENKEQFEFVKNMVLAELGGDVDPSKQLNTLDSVEIRAMMPIENPTATDGE